MSIRAYGHSTTDHPTWASGAEYGLLNFVIPTIPNTYCYECVGVGVSGTVEPTWPTTPGQTVVDGDEEQENPVTWTCRSLVAPNPLSVELNTEVQGGCPYKDIWVRNSGEAEFIVYGSHDGSNWRQIDELETPQGDRDNRHKGLQNAYHRIKVVVDSPNESEIEIVAGA